MYNKKNTASKSTIAPSPLRVGLIPNVLTILLFMVCRRTAISVLEGTTSWRFKRNKKSKKRHGVQKGGLV